MLPLLNVTLHALFLKLCSPILRAQTKIQGIEIKDLHVGDEASQLRAMLQVNYPMDNGIVRSWEDMKHVWAHTWEKLEIDPTRCKVLL